MIRVAIGVLLLWVAPALTARADYTVQIAALRQPSAGLFDSASRFGEVRMVKTSEGITRYQVGRFANAGDARPIRDRLRSAGYTDAFVRHVPNLDADGATAITTIDEVSKLPSVSSAAADVPEEVREHMVLLDGELHVKDGDRFVPLEAYRAQRAR